MIGNHTFSREVKLLQGGSGLVYNQGTVACEKKYFFYHDSSNEEDDIDLLIEKLDAAYIKALKKRIDRPMNEIAVFLSGGMDSRMVLAALNTIVSDEKVRCVSFGQPKCEEVDVARKVAEVSYNDFFAIELTPSDHLSNAQEYAYMTCGSDMSAQSYIIDAAKTIRKRGISAFMTGSFIECHVGGTFLPDTAIETNEKLSQYLPQNMKAVKCELFSEEELRSIMISDAYETYFEGRTGNLVEEAQKYDGFPVKDIIQSFIIDNRDKRLVLNREIIPGQYLDYLNPNFDIDFLKVAARIPARERRKRKFYREYLVKKYAPYANVTYNNTTLPVSAPLEYWGEGSNIELQREKLFSELQKVSKNVYYPHFYSDFDGYSRYDETWAQFFYDTLLADNAFLVGKIISRDAVEKMLDEHKKGLKNNRKLLLNLASLELFFNLNWEDK